MLCRVMSGERINVSVQGKISKNCAACLGFHPAPFGKSCRYKEEPAESDLTMAAERSPGGAGILKSPK